jgi:hypothetical protein
MTEAIVKGPLPRDDGLVAYIVDGDGYCVEIIVSPLGVGVAADIELAVANRALRLVHEVTSENRMETRRRLVKRAACASGPAILAWPEQLLLMVLSCRFRLPG